MDNNVIVKAENLEKIYGIGRSALRVLKGISLEIKKGRDHINRRSVRSREIHAPEPHRVP